MRLWLNGWRMFFRAVRMARAKRHGAGRMPWRYAIKMGLAYRWIVYGQRMMGGLRRTKEAKND